MEDLSRDQLQKLTRPALEAFQLQRLNRLLETARSLPFYKDRLSSVSLPLNSIEQISCLPVLAKSELLSDRSQVSGKHIAAGKIFGLPQHQYTRFHQTSGTSGWPMPVLDTPADWDWWLQCWQC